MHAASREALARLNQRLDAALARSSDAVLSDLSDQLYAVVDVLHDQPRLRRALADPATPAEGRTGLVSTLFETKIGDVALELTRDAVAERWSSPWDLLDGLESIADEVSFGAAERTGQLSEIEDELFRFGRVLDASPELAELLDDHASAPQRRSALVDSVVAGKVNPITQDLLRHAVTSRRKHTAGQAIDALLEAAAVRQQRSIAKVTSAVELSAQQQTRLANVLTELYGRTISVHTALDPSVRGGLVVRVGDEIIDGSIAAKLVQARAALAG